MEKKKINEKRKTQDIERLKLGSRNSSEGEKQRETLEIGRSEISSRDAYQKVKTIVWVREADSAHKFGDDGRREKERMIKKWKSQEK